MVSTIRTDSNNPDFRNLVQKLDQDLAIRDGEEHAFFAQFNGIESIRHVIVAYNDDQACGCGAMKEYSPQVMEIKRMYVPPAMRRARVASLILSELEEWARVMGYRKCILETGRQQPEAIGLYARSNYNVIPNYGQYAEVESSVCFEKAL